MAEQTQAAEPAAPKPAPKRLYGVYSEVKINPADPEAIKALTEHLPEGAEEVTVLVQVGQAVAANPKASVKALAEIKVAAGQSMVGDFEAISDSARAKVENVRAQLKPSVSIG